MENEKRLIDKQTAIKLLRGQCVSKYPSTFTMGLFAAADEIARISEVDAVEVVHGRWIEDGGIDEDGNGRYRCSCCGAGEKHYPTVPVSYCWNCGAKMDGERRNDSNV